jgi:hypothetical protein
MRHSPRLAGLGQILHVLDSTVWLMNIFIVRNTIAYVVLGGFVHRGHVDNSDAEVFNVVNLADNTGDVAETVAIGIL